MIRELLDSIRATLYERATSPLLGVFLVSWLGFNWRIPTVLVFGTGDVFARIEYIETLAANLDVVLWGPLITTAVILATYPLVAVAPFAWWELGARWRNNLKKRIEKKQLLTLEQANALRAHLAKLQSEYGKEISAKDSEIGALKSQLEGVTNASAEAEKQRQVARNQLDSSTRLRSVGGPPVASFAALREGRSLADTLLDELGDGGDDLEVVRVSSAQELVSAITPNRIIRLAAGDYVLSDVRTAENPYIGTRSSDEPAQNFVIQDVSNFYLMADSKRPVRLLVEPAYSWVLEFSRCDRVLLQGMELGHIPEGHCAGGVVRLDRSSQVVCEGCVLFGCGTVGVELADCDIVALVRTEIRDCTQGIAYLSDSRDVEFRDSAFRNNGGWGDMVSLIGSKNVVIRDSLFESNQAEDSGPQRRAAFFSVSDSSSLLLLNSEVRGNRAAFFERRERSVWLHEVELAGNQFDAIFELPSEIVAYTDSP